MRNTKDKIHGVYSLLEDGVTLGSSAGDPVDKFL